MRFARSAPREPGLVVQAADFSAPYSPIERPRFPPEKLLRAMLLQLFSARSERQVAESLEFDLSAYSSGCIADFERPAAGQFGRIQGK
jgi:hypothetical protein